MQRKKIEEVSPKETKSYHKPTLKELGSLKEETKGSKVGGIIQDSGRSGYTGTA